MGEIQHKDITGDGAIHPSNYYQSADPGAVGANKMWLDTTTTPPVQKRRNSTNSGWDEVLDPATLSGGVSDGDKGDITVSGTGTVYTIDSGAVTYAKMQDVSAGSKLLGRGDSGTGDPQEITLGANLTMTGTTLAASGSGTLGDGDYGDITASSSGTVLTIDNDVVSYAKMQNVSAASKLIGRGDSGSGDPQEITLGTNLSMSGTTLNAAGSASTEQVDMPERVGTATSGTANAAKGVTIVTDGTVTVSRLWVCFNRVSAATYKMILAELNGSSVIQSIVASANLTGASTLSNVVHGFDITPTTLTAATTYAVMLVRTDAGNTHALPIRGGGGTQYAIPGLDSPAGLNAVLAQATPAVGQTVTASGAASFSIGLTASY